jgi:hypothetical protein
MLHQVKVLLKPKEEIWYKVQIGAKITNVSAFINFVSTIHHCSIVHTLLLSHDQHTPEPHLSIFHVLQRIICLLQRKLFNHTVHIMSLRKLNRLLSVQPRTPASVTPSVGVDMLLTHVLMATPKHSLPSQSAPPNSRAHLPPAPKSTAFPTAQVR